MGIEKYRKRNRLRRKIVKFIFFGIFIGIIFFIFNRKTIISLVVAISSGLLLFIISILLSQLKAAARVKKIEAVFPDFLQLMSSNLHAGITIDRAMLLSAREEFAPLDKEILKAGRDIATGKEIRTALLDMSKRIKSPKISKTIKLILSGISAGGNVATLLEETSTSMKNSDFMEKKATSNVLMYIIFIFLAVSIGSPGLFGLSNLLVDVLTTILSGLPEIENSNMPITLSAINISTTFIFYFSIVFIIALDVMASLVLGLVSKGKEKEGLKYFPALLGISLSIFFIIKILLASYFKGIFA
jgi:archaeal flagellar protein FlaJ